jgi:ribonuclease P protein component
METKRNGFAKNERLCKKSVIEKLYAEGRSVAVFPLRAVYLPVEPEEGTPAATVLISVSKKRFRHAVDRNLVKRRLREAYRLNKHTFIEALHTSGTSMAVAILYLDKRHHTFAYLQSRTKKLLKAIIEKENEK